MDDDKKWITLATTPPSSPEDFGKLEHALKEQHIEAALEENPVRQCENDVAFWLRVHPHDLPLAWDLARRLSIEPLADQ